MSQQRPTRPQHFDMSDGGIDAGLELLLAVTPPGETRSLREIAKACGCSWQAINYIEQQAIRKIRAALEQRGIGPDVLSD